MEKIKYLSEDVIRNSIETEEQLKAKTAENNALILENRQLKRQVESLKDADAKITSLTKENTMLKGLIQKANSEKLEAVNELNRKRSQFEAEKKALQEKYSQLEARIGKAAELEQKILVLNKNNEFLLQEKQSLQKKLIEFEHRSKQWEQSEEKIKQLEETIEKLDNEKNSIKAKLKKAEDELEQ